MVYLSEQQLDDCSKQNSVRKDGLMAYAVTIYMTKGISSESSYPYTSRDGVYISEGRELNRAAWSDCCPVQRLGPHTLLPAKRLGPHGSWIQSLPRWRQRPRTRTREQLATWRHTSDISGAAPSSSRNTSAVVTVPFPLRMMDFLLNAITFS